jgi:NAD(P)-dependent dehydrogenase (short-subunit alcohol dehydrogenase family)
MQERSAMFRLEGKDIVITGVLGQLGTHCAVTLAEQGARIIGIDIADQTYERVKKLSEAIGYDRFLYCRADITDLNEVKQVYDYILTHWSIPHVLINNAALDSPPGSSALENGPFETYPESSWDKIMSVNVKGTYIMCQIFGGAMAKHQRGSIINIASIYGLVSPNQDIYEYRRQRGEIFYKPVAYSVSKSALFNLTRYLSTYWARKNVRVNTLTLAGIFNNQDKEFLQEYCKHIPIGRMADPKDYMGAMIFLSSDASSYMTGSNMIIDGGWTAW